MESGALIDLEQGEQVAFWASRLGVSAHELQAVAAIVGRSPGALSRHFGKAACNGPVDFSSDPLACQLGDLLSRLRVGIHDLGAQDAQIAPLLARVTAAIRQGQLRLSYLPPPADTVSLPATIDPLYIQALLYWRIRLDAPVPLLLDACSQLGENPSIDDVQCALNDIYAAREPTARPRAS